MVEDGSSPGDARVRMAGRTVYGVVVRWTFVFMTGSARADLGVINLAALPASARIVMTGRTITLIMIGWAFVLMA